MPKFLLFFIVIIMISLPLKSFETEFGDFDEENFMYDEIYDPLEPINRVFFYTYRFIYDHGGKQTVVLYEKSIPKYTRNRLSNFVSNLREPWNAVNHFAQLNIKSGFESIIRFTFNTTLGFLGFIDIMSPAGLPRKDNDLGATLAFYGVGEGPFLMILGPSNLRDTTGSVTTIFSYQQFLSNINQLNLTSVGGFIIRGDTVVFLLDTGSTVKEYESFIRPSTDEYTTMKTLYSAFRAQEVKQMNSYD